MTRPRAIPHEAPLFDWESPLARPSDPDTSHEAGGVVRPHLGRIQALVLGAFRAHGPMTARAAERLPEFGGYGFSTIRKRISELAKRGDLVEAGTDTSGKAPCTIYQARDLV